MKYIFIFSFIIFSSFTYSQTKPSNKKQAMAIAQFSRNLIADGQPYISGLKSYEEVFPNIEQNIEMVNSSSSIDTFLPIECPVINSTISTNKILEDGNLAKQNLTEIQEFDKLIKVANSYTRLSSIQCNNIKAYFLNKNYLYDSTGITSIYPLRDSLKTLVKNAGIAWVEIINLASHTANDAENILLKRAVNGKFIIPMKNDLTRIQDIVLIMEKDSMDVDKIQTLNSELILSIKKNTSLVKKSRRVHLTSNQKKLFSSFYLNCQSIQDEIQIFLNSKPLNKSNSYFLLQKIEPKYNEIVDQYNSFIKKE